MKISTKRVHKKSTFDLVIEKIQEYAYLETFVIVCIYLLIGYSINSNDICLLNGKVSYILILLSIITLFHGFENGLFALGLIAIAIWYFYPVFEYIEFLVALMMTLIFSEFHYYWTKKIREAELNANYSGTKLDELTKGFYTLKISHDQLEKNYVVKPMSIRGSIEQIVNENLKIKENSSIDDKNKAYYKNFLLLLEKSFNVQRAFVVYMTEGDHKKSFSEENTTLSFGTTSQKYESETIFNDYLVDKALNRKKPVYVSDEKGEPNTDNTSKFITVIPSIQHDEVVSLLVIEKMPFMAFNRENLTSISILLEYFTLEISIKNTLSKSDDVLCIKDEKFRYEYERMSHLYRDFKVSSIALVLRISSELQATRIYDKVISMLRSLDIVTLVNQNGLYYIILFFPLHDKSAALGYLNRLLSRLEGKDKNFDSMTFDMGQNILLSKYLREDYDE